MISALPYRTERLEQRFWAKVDQSGDCWVWTASTCGAGYGQFFVHKANNRPYMALAHRVAYELLVGPIPEGLTVDHLCKNIRCVNPQHFDIVTQGENVKRSVPKNARKTSCPKGHSYDRVDYWTDSKTGEQKYGRRCSRCRSDLQKQRR